MPPAFACLMTDRIFVPKMRFDLPFLSSAARLRHRLHQLNTILFGGKALVDFQKWDDSLHVPKIVASWLSFNFPVHRVLEEDCSQNPLAVESSGW